MDSVFRRPVLMLLYIAVSTAYVAVMVFLAMLSLGIRAYWLQPSYWGAIIAGVAVFFIVRSIRRVFNYYIEPWIRDMFTAMLWSLATFYLAWTFVHDNRFGPTAWLIVVCMAIFSTMMVRDACEHLTRHRGVSAY